MVFHICAFLFLGMILGSFATAVAHREMQGAAWWVFNPNMSEARSQCPQCHHNLKILDLIPVLSWLFSRGRCRYCQSPIPKFYIIIELVSSIACLLVFVFMGLSLESFLVSLSIPFLIALTVIDIKQKILPDRLVIILGVLGCLVLASKQINGLDSTLIWEHALGGLIFPGLLWLLGAFMSYALKRKTLGLGDVKFFAVAGLWLGLSLLPYFMIISGLFGIVLGLLWRFYHKDPIFPFGPALVLSFSCVLLWQGFL